MSEMYSWASPDAVSHMTLPQLKMYLSGDTKQSGGRPANAFANKAERDAYVEKVRKEHREKGTLDGLSDS